MKAYIINLDKDKDRFDFMEDQMKRLGIDFIRIEGVYGKDYRGKDYNSEKSKIKNGKDLSSAELGCSLSHRLAWQIFLESGDRYGIIMEDDIKVLDKDFKQILLKETESNIKNHSWEYLQFDYISQGLFYFYNWNIELFRSIKKELIFKKKFILSIRFFIRGPVIFLVSIFSFFRNIFYRGIFFSKRSFYFAGCYLLTRSGAKVLLDNTKEVYMPADQIQNELKKEKKLKVAYYCPLIVEQQRKVFKSNIA